MSCDIVDWFNDLGHYWSDDVTVFLSSSSQWQQSPMGNNYDIWMLAESDSQTHTVSNQLETCTCWPLELLVKLVDEHRGTKQ